MAEDLDDGEFWLPSHFLTDDDILMDFGFSASKSNASSSTSDLDFASASTETESDEEDILLPGLTHQLARSNLNHSPCPVHSKGWVLSSSPQSTLCGCLCNQYSSRESPSGPISPPQPLPQAEDENNATLDLLHKAAGEVARLKMRTEKSTGTGFFDCSQKGVLYPPPLRTPEQFLPPPPPPPLYFQPQFHHFPPMVFTPSYNQPKQPQNRATKNNKSSNNNNNNKSSNNNSIGNNNRPLGLPPSAWPPLQPQAQKQAHPMTPIFVGPKRESVGTGVFLPRGVTTSPAPETRKKSDGNFTKSKAGKGLQSQSQSQSNNRRNSRTTTSTVNHNEIQLPQEWTY